MPADCAEPSDFCRLASGSAKAQFEDAGRVDDRHANLPYVDTAKRNNPDRRVLPASDCLMLKIRNELEKRGASSRTHGRGSLIQHLLGTFDLLSAWGQPDRIRYAGVLHNAYGTEAFHYALFDPNDREEVRELIGSEAEHLVYLFCLVERATLFDRLRAEDGVPSKSMHLLDRRQGVEIELSVRDVADLLVLYLANAADQACAIDGGPTYWLASASELTGWIAKAASVVPPILKNCSARISRDREERALENYDTSLRFLNSNLEFAMARMRSAARQMPHIAEPLVWLGYKSLTCDDARSAIANATKAANMLRIWGTPWDKRLTLQRWQALASTLSALGHRQLHGDMSIGRAVRQILEMVVNSPHDLYLSVEGLGQKSDPDNRTTDEAAAVGRLPPRFRRYIDRQEQKQPGDSTMYPGLTAMPWHNARQFPIAMALEDFADEIAQELKSLDARLFVDEAEQETREGRWSVAFLAKPGECCKAVTELCPVTHSILEAHFDETLLAGVAYFSSLEPGTRVAPHRGPTNTRLRCHLGVEIPDKCGLRVGGIARTWSAGRCLVFDDSFVHEVWNLSSQRRVVLIVDVWHPDLSPDEISLLQWMSL